MAGGKMAGDVLDPWDVCSSICVCECECVCRCLCVCVNEFFVSMNKCVFCGYVCMNECISVCAHIPNCGMNFALYACICANSSPNNSLKKSQFPFFSDNATEKPFPILYWLPHLTTFSPNHYILVLYK